MTYYVKTYIMSPLFPLAGRDLSPLGSSTSSGQTARTTRGAAAERRDAGSVWRWHFCLPRALPPSPGGPEGQGATARSGWGMSSAALFGWTFRWGSLKVDQSHTVLWQHLNVGWRLQRSPVWSRLASELSAFSWIFRKSTSLSILLCCIGIWNVHIRALIF